ncbi:MmcQ/YjbR family DNA-binding protein [Aristaeella hokkaidonensis]|uniref:MmcQ/YjbR family DNA-binding protein n=1 Tax=Aristaeella hokkaidonensis TaxID=3046382 RepID=A0AC61MYW8_9FIRM|nr:MmcQ/YjbR family DNA-binding protein [Aristaeella hokkaidonensis]SNT93497.1 Predicted DNA-binding protein, MmcQ/YjbR family [Aristaeella hokkaidonensis]
MKYPWIDEYLMAKRGVTKDLQAEWNWIRYHIGSKMFAAVLLDHDDRPYYINLKLNPAEGELMRKQYPDVIPGYYSNKLHWNSVKPDGDIPDDLLKTWLDRSYLLVLQDLPKAKQREILGLSVCGTDCSACPLHGNLCTGCNEACGKVFHAPEGKPCPIYGCCVNKHHYATCASCSRVPCAVWQATRDPSMTDEQFEQSVNDRVSALRKI